jgi:hypothetical protein
LGVSGCGDDTPQNPKMSLDELRERREIAALQAELNRICATLPYWYVEKDQLCTDVNIDSRKNLPKTKAELKDAITKRCPFVRQRTRCGNDL